MSGYTLVQDAAGARHYVTWCDGRRMRLTPEAGDPMASNSVPADFDRFKVVEGADWLERMIHICGPSIAYCDHCKADSVRCSKAFYPEGGEKWKTGDTCPHCESAPIEMLASLDDIP